MVTIDSLNLGRCALIKIDVEGMERAVLDGAAKTIARCLPLLYVENDRPKKAAELVRAMNGLGYAMFGTYRPFIVRTTSGRTPPTCSAIRSRST